MKRYLAPIGWALGMLALILDGRTAMTGAAEGLQLCIGTLIPNLFPFFLLSAMLTGSLSGGGLLLSGILAGYPVGAANAARAYREGRLTREEAERMVVLCSCAGPSFLFGVAGPVLGNLKNASGLWIAYLSSVFALWLIFPKSKPLSGSSRPVTLQQAMTASIRSMAAVCGWVMVFRVALAFLDRWFLWLLPSWGRVAVYGILELSNGILALEGLDADLALILAAGFTAFGGLCVLLQTAGVTEGLSLKLYFPGKIFQSAVAMLAASFLVPGAVSPVFQFFLCLAALLTGAGLRKYEKRCGNLRRIIV